ncbi:MAG: geranylgeranylglycerol-phosphate geranylgeranyltransferase [Bacteroidia bacterium]|nr:geranylgeranylglycerol-phosphate geranylgeranyltransferase [Bacteroidia bacterium]
MVAFFRLIRYQNLLIIALTQYLMRWCVINPILKLNGFELQLGEFNFFLLVLSTLLITAAGYIINDYFDRKADMLNRPARVVIGKMIDRRSAMMLHIIFNVAGVLIGAFLCFSIGHIGFSVIYILIVGLLWYYSTTYKRQFLIGNIIVALLTALVPFMVILFEVPLLNVRYKEVLLQYGINFNIILAWVACFSYFAFLTTLFREIIKDIEDFEGDYELGRNSLPVLLGVFYSKVIVISLIVFTIISLLFIYFRYTENIFSLLYFIIALIAPMLFLIYRVIRARNKNDYHFAGNLSKIIMLLGIGYAIYINLI